MTRLQKLAQSEWNRAAAPLKEDIIRRIRGDRTYTETISAVVQLDTAAAGDQAANGGLQQQQDRNQVELAGLVEVAATQEIFHDDAFEINGGLWYVAGLPTASDGGSKTVTIQRTKRITGRQPNTNSKP